MEDRTIAIIATMGGCTFMRASRGLIACLFGVLIAAGVPFYSDFNGISGYRPLPLPYGIVLFCVAIIFFLFPVLVGFFTLRKKPAAATVFPPE